MNNNKPLIIKTLKLTKDLIPGFEYVISNKLNKGDIQAEFNLRDSTLHCTPEISDIKVNLKQLFIIFRALTCLPDEFLVLELINPFPDIPFSHKLYLKNSSNQVIKDLTFMGVTSEDLSVRTDVSTVNHYWNRE